MFAVNMLMKMGLSLEASHYFILYTTSFGFITPPVAIAAIIACKLANAEYMPTAIEATKVGIGGFLVPWLFISTPMMLLLPGSFSFEGVIGVIISILIMIIFQIGFVGYMITNCSLIERIIAISSGTLMFLFIIQKNQYLLIIGLILFILLIVLQRKKQSFSKVLESKNYSF